MVKINFFNPTTFLSLFKYWMNIVIILCGIIQILFFPKNSTLFAVAIILIGWFLVNTLILTRTNFINYTFSTFLLLGFVITQYAFPLIFTLLEGKLVTYNLKIPYEVFTHSILALISIIIAHLFYKNWRKNSGIYSFNKTQHFLYKNYFFDAPTNKQLWIIGFIGIFALLSKYILGGNSFSEVNESNTLDKFIEGFIVFSYAPLFIPFSYLLRKSNTKSEYKKTYLIILYILLLIIIGVIGNSRGLFMKGLTAMALVFFLGLLIGKFDYKIFKIKNVIISVLSFWIITGPLSDIGTAMVIVRGQRGTISGTELLIKTLVVYQDKQAINNYKKLALSHIGDDWDEIYFDNIFLARFCNLKFNDSNLVQGLKIKEEDYRMFSYSVDRFWAILPSPILDLMQIAVDKKRITSSSFGDYLYFCNGGENALGGFRTGHFAGTGMASFGWWYLVILGIGMIPLFFLIDLFSFNFKINNTSNIVFSLAGLFLISTIFTFWGTSSASESVVSIYTFLLRGWLQSILLYFLVFKFSFIISKTSLT